jgi:hypothetical protein
MRAKIECVPPYVRSSMDDLPMGDIREVLRPAPRSTMWLLLLLVCGPGVHTWSRWGAAPASAAGLAQPERSPDPPPPCVGNGCGAPACGDGFSPGVVVRGLSVSGQQEALQGASADGSTLLFQRGPRDACVGGPDTTALLLADKLPGASGYTIADVTRLPRSRCSRASRPR